MSVDIAELGFGVETADLVKAKRHLDDLVPATERAEKASDKFEKRVKQLDGSMGPLGSSLTKTIGLVKKFAAGFAAAFGAREYIKLADAWSDISARVGLAVGDMDAAAGTMQRLSEIAKRTYSSLTNTAEGFISQSTALRELGYSTNQSLDYIEALNNALVVSGARGQRAEAIMNNLSKAMGGGALRGQELNSILQSGGRVAELIAAELGVTTTQLRALGAQGAITGNVIYRSLVGNLELLREEADGMPATVGDAMTRIGNAVLKLVGVFDTLTGTSGTVAKALLVVEGGIEILTGAVQVGAALFREAGRYAKDLAAQFNPTLSTAARIAGTALLALSAPAILAGIGTVSASVATLSFGLGVTLVNASRVALGALWTLATANPFGVLVAGVAAIGTAIYLFRDQISNVLGIDVPAVARDAANKLIGAFKFGFDSVVIVWNQLPSVIGEAVIAAANATLSTITNMVNGAIGLVNGAIERFNSLPAVNFGTFGNIEGPSIDNPFAGAGSDMAGAFGDAADSAFSTDYLGAAGTAMQTVIERTKELMGTVPAVTGALDDAAMAADGLAASMGGGRDGAGGLGGATAAAVASMDTIGGAVGDLENKMRSLGEQSLKSLGDQLASLAVDGKANFSALAKSIIRDLISMAIQAAITRAIMGGAPAGGGFAFASGGAFSPTGVTAFAKGGAFSDSIVNRPTAFQFAKGDGFGLGVMGEAGPEAVMPLTRGPDGSLGVQMYGNGDAPRGGRDEPMRLEVGVTVGAHKGDLFDPYVEGVATEVFNQGSEAMNRDMPDRVMQIINDERAR